MLERRTLKRQQVALGECTWSYPVISCQICVLGWFSARETLSHSIDVATFLGQNDKYLDPNSSISPKVLGFFDPNFLSASIVGFGFKEEKPGRIR